MTLWCALVVQLLIALSSFFGGRDDDADERSSKQHETPTVTLFVPCCGEEEGLAANLKALSEQDYPNLQLVFVVESEEDAAITFIEPLRGELVIAGSAKGRGQKVHNLLASLEPNRPASA